MNYMIPNWLFPSPVYLGYHIQCFVLYRTFVPTPNQNEGRIIIRLHITQWTDKFPPPSAQQTSRHAARMSVSSKATVMSFRSRRGLRCFIGPGLGVMAVWCVKAIRRISVQMVWSNAVRNLRPGQHPAWVIYDDLLRYFDSFSYSSGVCLLDL